MRKLLSILVVVVALAGAMIAIPVFAEDVTAVVDLDPAAFEFPEGLAVDADGNIYFGLAPTREIRRMTPSGEVSSFANRPLLPKALSGRSDWHSTPPSSFSPRWAVSTRRRTVSGRSAQMASRRRCSHRCP